MENALQTTEKSDDQRFIQELRAIALDPNTDVERMKGILDIQERLMTKQAESLFNQAYMRLQEKLPRIKKDGSVEYKNKKTSELEKAFDFAKWESIDSIIRPLLKEEGFALSFTSKERAAGGGAIITGVLMHVAGHTMEASMPLPLDSSGGKGDLQGMGSTLSYGKRYCTIQLLNLVFEGDDDDGVRGQMRFITDVHAKQIDALIEETKTNRVGFLQNYFGVVDTANILLKDKDRAINLLRGKLAKLQGAQNG
jgi:hypothetical protein